MRHQIRLHHPQRARHSAFFFSFQGDGEESESETQNHRLNH